MSDLEQLKYPIGVVSLPNRIEEHHLQEWIDIIAGFPTKVEKEITDLQTKELQYKYRPKGWTILQVLHHCADSHLNSFTRYKLALTEENPIIRPYFEDKWAELPDTLLYPPNESIQFLKSLHKRWVFLLEQMSKQDYLRTFTHPESNETINLASNTGIYAWHCEHHLHHIKNAKHYKFE